MQGYSKFITFLKALEMGLEIDIQGRTYSIAYDNSDKPRITHKMVVINSETNKERFEYMQGLDLPDINNFIISIINKISDEEETIINANIALNKIKRND